MGKDRKNIPGEEGSVADFFFEHTLSIKDKKLKNRRREKWVEDSFISYSDEELSASNKHYIGIGLSRARLLSVLVVVIIAIGILFSRAAFLQVVKGEEYRQTAEMNRLRVYHIKAPRGIIYDRNGVPLVANRPSFALYITPIDFPTGVAEKEAFILTIKKYFPEYADTVEEPLDKILALTPLKKEYFQAQPLITDIDYESAVKMRVASAQLPGVSVEVTTVRQYLGPESENLSSLSHVLGYVGKINEGEYEHLEESGYLLDDVLGKAGIEKEYETLLRGTYGRKQVEVDSRGKEIKVIAQEDVIPGASIVLSIDVAMQEKLEALLKEQMAKTGQSRAAAVIQDPQSGEVLAAVSLPSYDNNKFTSGISQEDYKALVDDPDKPLFNRFLSGEYPSGSTIKPVIAVAALQEGIISEDTTFLSSGGIQIGQWFFPDWRAGGHGITDVRYALAQSVNTFFYIIGGGYKDFVGMGIRTMVTYGKLFGLSAPTGIDLPNEASGFLPTPEWKQEVKHEQWYIGDTYHVAIGQGDVLVTPLQVNNYTAAFANGGVLYRPRLLHAIIPAGEDKEIVKLPEVKNEQFVDRDNLEVVREGMRQAVTSGSARSLNSLPVAVAGKTGTAQWGSDKLPHAWFISFAPYVDPELAITVLIEEGEEGSRVATPVVNKFYRWYFSEYKPR